MSVSVVLNGVSYSIPEPGDTGWGQGLTDYFVAQASGLLQKAGGAFTLTAEVDFGATYGLKSSYFKSRTTNAASAGQLRLANADLIDWRNFANDGNLTLGVNASNLLVFNGTTIQPSGNYITALTGDVTASGPGSAAATIAAGAVTNAKVSASAAIAYSKLALTSSIVNADLANMTAHTFKGNNTGSTGVPLDLTVAQLTAELNVMTGAGGTGLKGLVPSQVAGDATKVLSGAGTWVTAGTGTVTSVTFTGDGAVLSSTPSSAVTTSGTVTASLNTQTARTFLSGPASGSAATPTFKALVAPTVQKFTTGSGTYTTPTSPAPLYVRVRMVGGGGGGSGSGTASWGTGGAGGNTTFGTTLLAANGGSGGNAPYSSGGGGGTASLGTGPIGTALAGQAGLHGLASSASTSDNVGGAGGSSFFGGGGVGGNNGVGGAGITNTGSGGGGGGILSVASSYAGNGGGAGGFIDAIITSPSATYSYAVGAAGTAGTLGTSGAAGGAGAAGYIEVTEFYQ